MQLENELKTRSNNSCELCQATGSLVVYDLQPEAPKNISAHILICNTCLQQLDKQEPLAPTHWEILGTTMWSEVPAVQVAAWRMLQRLRNESWAAEQLDMLYLEDDLLNWAKATGDHELEGELSFHKDSNGALLKNGDSVVLTKSLDVKGSTLNAKMGTVVKNIRLVPDNTEQIEGKIEGQTIVILTKYLRRQSN